MELERAIVDAGTIAIKQYRTLAATRRENDIALGFLRSKLAVALAEKFGVSVRLERQYSVVAMELNIEITQDLLLVFGGESADVILYTDDKPSAIILVEIYDYASVLPKVNGQLHRALTIRKLSNISLFMDVMVCPVSSSLEARLERLHDAVGGNLYVGERQLSHDERWSWCFSCASLR